MSDSGHIEDAIHRFAVRVYYEDTDFSGVVYHANYLKFFERGRSEYLRLLGVHHHELAALPEPLAFAVAEIAVRFKSPARIDDQLAVETRLKRAGGALFVLDQRILRGEILIAEQTVTVVSIDTAGKPRRLPEPLASILKAALAG